MMTKKRSFDAPRVNMKEILRYAGGGDEVSVRDCLAEAEGALTYNVCFAETAISVKDDTVELGFASVRSRGLAKNLAGCDSAVIFAATVGVGIDRLIGKYNRLSPSRAVLLQAIGSERVESLCDAFVAEIKSELDAARVGTSFRPRFSPGYGDLSLELQRDVFRFLDCPRQIGITLGDSLLMSPSKSVTAIIGVTDK